ncbi:MAG: cytochrome c oxidase subunit II [Pseudonocardia sp.]|nr:cytochrome c oxidase subunit II [Pseudonocardia sp.]
MPFRSVFDQIFTIWTAIAGGVFVLVTAVLLFAVVRNRATKREHLPFAASENHKVEFGYVVVLGLIVAGLVTGSFLAISRLHSGEGLAEEAMAGPSTRIDVTAFRWCWEFAYAEAPVTVTGTCTSDDSPVVVVPTDRPVEFALTSSDVVHSFWIPDWAAKMDAYPDDVNELRMVFPEEGMWRGLCSEFCGTHHVTMDFYVRAVSPAEYEQYLAAASVAA